jgi:hypothetical protein
MATESPNEFWDKVPIRECFLFLASQNYKMDNKTVEDQWPVTRIRRGSERELPNLVSKPKDDFQERAKYGVGKALERTDIFDLNEWQLHVERLREHKAEVLQLFNRFQGEREKCGSVAEDVRR